MIPHPLHCTHWATLKNPHGRRFSTNISALYTRFLFPTKYPSKDQCPGWSPATFHGDMRGKDNVLGVDAIGLDIDDTSVSFDHVLACLDGCLTIVHSTWSSTPDAPKTRAIVVTARTMTPEEYDAAWRGLVTMTGLPADPSTKDPSRLWYVPALRYGYRCVMLDGAAISVESTMRCAPELPPTTFVEGVRGVTGHTNASAVERALAYVARCDPAVSGSGGHRQTFYVAQRVVRGFDLSFNDAVGVMLRWNKGCSPQWSVRDIERKVTEAAAKGTFPRGALLGEKRRTG